MKSKQIDLTGIVSKFPGKRSCGASEGPNQFSPIKFDRVLHTGSAIMFPPLESEFDGETWGRCRSIFTLKIPGLLSNFFHSL